MVSAALFIALWLTIWLILIEPASWVQDEEVDFYELEPMVDRRST